jgi:hypothetical protein
MDELLLRELTPAVIGVLVHRGVDFATDAARSAPNLAERHHLTRQAARISHVLRG